MFFFHLIQIMCVRLQLMELWGSFCVTWNKEKSHVLQSNAVVNQNKVAHVEHHTPLDLQR